METGSDPAGSRAVDSEGGDLTVEDCFFAGFATALEVHSIGGATTTLRQSMIVPAAGRPSPSVPPDRPGWGLRMEFMSGGQAGSTRKLILDHCTFAGSGFLQLAGFSPQYPLRVEPRGCAVQAEALVAWEPAQREIPLDRTSVQWSGQGNHLDITTPSWIVMSAGDDARADQGDHRPGELVEGRRRGGPDPREHPLRDQSRLATRDDPAGRFRDRSTGPLKAGADPDQVGPKKAGHRPRREPSGSMPCHSGRGTIMHPPSPSLASE